VNRADMFANTGDIDRSSAVASRPPARQLRRHLHAGVPHGIFPCRRVALVAPCLKVRLGPVGQKDGPCGFELGTRIVKGFSRTGPMFAGP
jgi:hypothetical protein